MGPQRRENHLRDILIPLAEFRNIPLADRKMSWHSSGACKIQRGMSSNVPNHFPVRSGWLTFQGQKWVSRGHLRLATAGESSHSHCVTRWSQR